MAKYCSKMPQKEIDESFFAGNIIIEMEKIARITRLVKIIPNAKGEWRMNEKPMSITLGEDGVPTDYTIDTSETLLQKVGGDNKDKHFKVFGLGQASYAAAINAMRRANLKVGDNQEIVFKRPTLHITWLVLCIAKDEFMVMATAKPVDATKVNE